MYTTAIFEFATNFYFLTLVFLVPMYPRPGKLFWIREASKENILLEWQHQLYIDVPKQMKMITVQ